MRQKRGRVLNDLLISDYASVLLEMIKKIDCDLSNIQPSCGTYSSYESDLFGVRIAVVEAYNKAVKTNLYTFPTQLNPFTRKIEPKDCPHLDDTITCPFTKEHSQSCGCFGRGYVTIRMLSEQGIRKYIEDEKKQNQYIKLMNGEELPIKFESTSNRLHLTFGAPSK